MSWYNLCVALQWVAPAISYKDELPAYVTQKPKKKKRSKTWSYPKKSKMKSISH